MTNPAFIGSREERVSSSGNLFWLVPHAAQIRPKTPVFSSLFQKESLFDMLGV